MARVSVPRWSVYVVASALIASLSFSAGSFFSASGTDHDTTFYACLYAGSLSQVGATPPANCGRGTEISWSSEGPVGPEGPSGANGQNGPSGTSQAYRFESLATREMPNITLPDVEFATLYAFELPAGSYALIAVGEVMSLSGGGSATCQFVTGTQALIPTQVAGIASVTMTMSGVVELSEPAIIEVRCGADRPEISMLSLAVTATQHDVITQVTEATP